jgi:hypothetical protein
MGSSQRLRRLATLSGGMLFGAGLLAAAVAPTPVAAAASQTQAPAATPVHFTWETSTSNSSGDSTYINSSATNGKPHALLFVTPTYVMSGSGVYDDNPIGVWYVGGEWAIFNENGATMPLDMLFNVLVVPAPTATAFVFTSASSNIEGSTAFINSSKTNGQKSIKLQVTQLWNPGGVGGANNNSSIGVFYNTPTPFHDRWGVFDQNDTGIPVGVSFNVLVGAIAHGKLALQKATAPTRVDDFTLINNATLNNHPAFILFSTPVYDPNGRGGVFDADPTGVWYDGSDSRWTVFQEGVGAVPLNAAFNLLFYPVV